MLSHSSLVLVVNTLVIQLCKTKECVGKELPVAGMLLDEALEGGNRIETFAAFIGDDGIDLFTIVRFDLCAALFILSFCQFAKLLSHVAGVLIKDADALEVGLGAGALGVIGPWCVRWWRRWRGRCGDRRIRRRWQIADVRTVFGLRCGN